jgi:F-type H+-transporting ATPase subunit alpha
MALSLYAVEKGYLSDQPVNKILAFEAALQSHFAQGYGELMNKIVQSGDWNDEIEAQFKKGIEEFRKTGSW